MLARRLRRHANMTSEATMNVVARKDLVAANLSATSSAGSTLFTRDDRRNHHRCTMPLLRPGARGYDRAADLVAEREWQRMTRGNGVVVEGEVGVADTAPRDLDKHLAGPGQVFS